MFLKMQHFLWNHQAGTAKPEQPRPSFSLTLSRADLEVIASGLIQTLYSVQLVVDRIWVY